MMLRFERPVFDPTTTRARTNRPAIRRTCLAVAAMLCASVSAQAIAEDVRPGHKILKISAATSCEGLAALTLPNTTVTIAKAITGGQFTPPGSSTAISNLPAFCQVHLIVKPAINVRSGCR